MSQQHSEAGTVEMSFCRCAHPQSKDCPCASVKPDAAGSSWQPLVIIMHLGTSAVGIVGVPGRQAGRQVTTDYIFPNQKQGQACCWVGERQSFSNCKHRHALQQRAPRLKHQAVWTGKADKGGSLMVVPGWPKNQINVEKEISRNLSEYSFP